MPRAARGRGVVEMKSDAGRRDTQYAKVASLFMGCRGGRVRDALYAKAEPGSIE